MKPMNWEQICDLITISANAANDLAAADGSQAAALMAEAQFLLNIETYCENERANVEMMLADVVSQQ